MDEANRDRMRRIGDVAQEPISNQTTIDNFATDPESIQLLRRLEC